MRLPSFLRARTDARDADSSLPAASAAPELLSRFTLQKEHFITRLRDTAPGAKPFRHLYVESVFHEELNSALNQLLQQKRALAACDRRQDNPAYANSHFSLRDEPHEAARLVEKLLSDPDVKSQLLSAFYTTVDSAFIDSLSLHHGEFEFVYTAAGRTQEIHTDIAPKYLSAVFYFPQAPLSHEEESKNGTVLYGKDLNPHHPAAFRANSAVFFASHFYSYHGFATTVGRDALVAFLVNQDELDQWNAANPSSEEPPFEFHLGGMRRRLEAFPLIEYADAPGSIDFEEARCRVNAPMGRVRT